MAWGRDVSGNRDDDDRERPDWRELDRRRDRSQHRHADAEPGQRRGSQRQQFEQRSEKNQQLKKLEALFGEAKPTAEQEKVLKKIRAAKDNATLTKQCAAFVGQFGLPRDWDSLLLFLDAADEELVLSVLEKLSQMRPNQSDIRKTNFSQQLRILNMMTQSEKVQAKVKVLLAQ